jgi:hypothetical protein
MWVPVTTAWHTPRLRMEERPPAMEGSCEYIEYPAADKRQGVVLQLGLGVGLTTLHRKNKFITKNEIEPRTWTYYLDKRPKLRNMDMIFGCKKFV